MKTQEALQTGSTGGVRAPRLLVALSAAEKRLFFEAPLQETLRDILVLEEDGEIDEPGWSSILRSERPDIIVTGWSTQRLPMEYLLECRDHLPYICNVTGSVRSIVPREFIEWGGMVSNWGDLASEQVAEHALLLALAALRNQSLWNAYIKSVNGTLRYPAAHLRTMSIYDRRIGIHGYGRIARSLVKLLAPFRAQISCFSHHLNPSQIDDQNIHGCETLEDLFAGNEVIFECESLTEESRLSVNAAVLARLPDDAIFVNVGRGWVVDEDALLDEAKRRRIRVAVDVLTDEPANSETALAQVAGVLVSPHIGGPTFDRYKLCGNFAVNNIRRYRAQLPPNATVDLSTYDRAT